MRSARIFPPLSRSKSTRDSSPQPRGNIKKWKGKLVGVNFDRVKRLVLESRAYLYQTRGLALDILA